MKFFKVELIRGSSYKLSYDLDNLLFAFINSSLTHENYILFLLLLFFSIVFRLFPFI